MDDKVDGPRAFCVAVAACLVQFTIFGVMNSFSIFTDDMSRDSSLGNPSQTQTSFGNSVGVGLSPIFGAFAGALADRFGPRVLLMGSVASIFGGLWLSALFASNAMTLVFLFSVPAGLASGLMLSPGAAAAASYFHKRRTLGTGIAFCGGGLGSCIVPALAGSWSSDGWRTAFKMMSGFCAVGGVAACFVTFHKPSSTEAVNEDDQMIAAPDGAASPVSTRPVSFPDLCRHALFTKQFLAHFISFALFTWAFYGLLYAAVPYTSSMGKNTTVYADYPKITTARASTLMTSFGVFQILGSLSMGFIAGKIGNKHTHAACNIVGAVGSIALAYCRSYAGFAVALSIVGFATAGVFATVPSMVANTYGGPNVGTLIGMTFAAAAIGGFSAPPILAALEAGNDGNYSYGWILVSLAQTGSGLICFFFIPEC